MNDKISNNIILKLFDDHMLMRIVRVKWPPVPWITKGVHMAMTQRDRAF